MSHIEWVIRGPAQRRPAQTLKDYAWEREQQLVTQRALLESLRYKHYARAGTLTSLLQRLGGWGRTYVPELGAYRARGSQWIPR